MTQFTQNYHEKWKRYIENEKHLFLIMIRIGAAEGFYSTRGLSDPVNLDTKDSNLYLPLLSK